MIQKYLNTISANCFILLIKIYQLTLSPLLRSNCRYLPTCSEYAVTALKEFGLIPGLYYSIKRMLSCHPYGGHGYDPVSKKLNKDS
tara:strand:- start:258 stop:515 length:258 start_codon:yes stop_codon:yes gene_type:complete